MAVLGLAWIRNTVARSDLPRPDVDTGPGRGFRSGSLAGLDRGLALRSSSLSAVVRAPESAWVASDPVPDTPQMPRHQHRLDGLLGRCAGHPRSPQQLVQAHGPRLVGGED